ncbi:hypothetical protein QAD02_000468 [Eretmocerus hayati]|uniref:Uncharacterized protein n=1 Tax=Eretmocerus hayati TaxID=131215 RepID=A0ACC2NDR3_9HYME|nr:hypothetical protein QAD02_000468 [Eretmocerus hayati]
MFSRSKPFIVLIILLWNTSEVTPSQVYPTPDEIIDRAWEIMGSIRSIRKVKNFNIDGAGIIHASIMKELRSLEDDIHYLEEAASSKLKTVNQTIADVMPRIFREMYYIQDCFKTFLQFYETSGKSSQEKTIESVNKILKPMTTSTGKARKVIKNSISNITESGLFEIFEPSVI